MGTKKSNHHSDNQPYDEIEYALFCDGLEKQYEQAKETGVFEVLKVLELDKAHSDENLVQAIDYFNKKDGLVEKDAPMDFLTEHEKSMVNQEEKFRHRLYGMLLSTKFAEAISNKSVFLQHSFKYGFDGE
ncbi:MAG: hypothetical protein QG556_590 [Pseudomonadota bacterium]|nr:hypothetical protein [Pseudomonadota bacterium]